MKTCKLNVRMLIHSFFIGVILAIMVMNMAVAAAPTSEDDLAAHPTSVVAMMAKR